MEILNKKRAESFKCRICDFTLRLMTQPKFRIDLYV